MRNTIDHRTVNILNKKMLRYFLEWLGMRGENPDEYIWYGDTTHKRDIRVDGAVHITGPVSASNTVTISNETQDFWVEQDLLIQHDTTIRDELYVERNAEIGHDLKVSGDALVQHDATVKGDLRVDGITHISTLTIDFDLAEVQDFTVLSDMIVQHDATIREGLFVGEMLTTQDLRVMEDMICVDATIKDAIYVDDERGTVGHPGRGVTTDITATGMIYRVVNGIITVAVQK